MSQFKKAFKGIDSAIKQGTARALNRALSSTKTKVVRHLREETGLKTDVVKTRTRSRKAKAERLDAILGIAVKYDVALTKFSPKEKIVRKVPKGGTRKRAYKGATVKVGKGARQLAPGAFLMQGKTVDGVVIQRKGEARNPLKAPKTKVFTEAAKAIDKPAQQHMRDTFDKIVAHEINYSVQRKFTQNK